MAESDGFLTRWSRRKLSVKEAEDAEASLDETIVGIETVPADVSTEPVPEGEGEYSETGGADEDEDHPAAGIDIDSLTKDSDFTVFMQKAVPAAVRRKALRKLWTSDPLLANLDGLNDYEDMEFTYGISNVANTEWKLGRGFLTDKDLGLTPEEPGDDENAVAEAEPGTGEAESPGAEQGEPDTPHDPDQTVADIPMEPLPDVDPHKA
mgnify:CR=1 FL=1